MLLIIHLIFAATSFPAMLLAVVNEYFMLAKSKLLFPVISAVSFIGLVITGTLLVVLDHGQVLGACTEGLLYLGSLIIPYGIARKMAAKKSPVDE